MWEGFEGEGLVFASENGPAQTLPQVHVGRFSGVGAARVLSAAN
jgi:hypothetical protein